METRDIFLVFSAMGAFQSFYLALEMFQQKDKHRTSSVLLSMLFFFLGIRVLKSTLFIYTSSHFEWLFNIGFAAQLAAGPLFLLYVLSSVFKARWKPVNWLHFAPVTFVLLGLFNLTVNNFWYAGGYKILLVHSMVYVIVAFGYILKSTSDNRITALWHYLLTGLVFTFFLSYFLNYFYHWVPYNYAPIIFVGFIQLISVFWLLHKGQIGSSVLGKYKNVNLSKDRLEHYRVKIEAHYQTKSPFLESDFSLSKLADSIQVPKYLLSVIFSSSFHMSFADYTNYKRIELAKKHLKTNPQQTIASVAYDCGFNSLSVFNNSFKKFTHTTPSEFKKKLKY